ncbi:MAG: competence/damage-inducible protein A [Fervidobacterium sp.]|nr:competence/damage-inducible protein A [Fervidobacterium sp.]
MKRAIIVAIGNELVEGLIVDTNSKYLSSKLKNIGYYVIRTETVPDRLDIIVDRISCAINEADLVVTTGGLGPTEDDLTREAIAYCTNRKLLKNEKLAEKIMEKALKYYKRTPQSVLKQAMVIEGALVIDNPVGTAPGQYIEYEDKKIILLPGPPVELIPIFENIVESIKTEEALYTRRIKTIGIPEAVLMEDYKEIIYSNKDITVATMASYERGVEIRLTGSVELKSEIDGLIQKLVSILGHYVYATDDDEMKDVIFKLLFEKQKTVAFAESCTGGMISSTLVDVPGISSVYKGTIVAYSNESKIKLLGVKEETINKYGAVSEECVREMAMNARNIFKVDYAVAVSGIAGPSGGTREKPVGTVCIAFASENDLASETYNLRGDRQMIRARTTLLALDMLRRGILRCQG